MIPASFIAKVIAGSLIPKLVHDGYVYCKKCYNEFTNEPKPRKQIDNSPWTQFRFDVVMNKRKTWLAYNKNPIHGRIPLKVLIFDINHTLDISKSQRAIAAIWEGKVDRTKLTKGGLSATKK